jgi:hypothetical protein
MNGRGQVRMSVISVMSVLLYRIGGYIAKKGCLLTVFADSG